MQQLRQTTLYIYKNFINQAQRLNINLQNSLKFNKQMNMFLQQLQAHKRRIPEFIGKLYHILQQNQYRDIICWVNENTEVLIKNPKKLQDKVLPYFFRHKHLTSFVRQLNMYGFNKVNKLTKQKNCTYFNNPLFKRGQIQQLTMIKRKNTKKNEEEEKIQASTVPIAGIPTGEVKLQYNDERVLSHTSQNQSVTPSFSYMKQVLNAVQRIEDQVQNVIEMINYKSHEHKMCLRRNRYSLKIQEGQFNTSIKSGTEEAVQKLKIVSQLCKGIKAFSSAQKPKIQLSELDVQFSSQESILNNSLKNTKQQINNAIGEQEDSKHPHKEINMFKSMREMFPRMDSFQFIPSQCSIDKDHLYQN